MYPLEVGILCSKAHSVQAPFAKTQKWTHQAINTDAILVLG